MNLGVYSRDWVLRIETSSFVILREEDEGGWARIKAYYYGHPLLGR